MILTPFETALYEKFHDFFNNHGFSLMADKKQFRKITPMGFQNVIFTITQYENETWLEVNIGCRHNQIEQIAQQFLNNHREFWADSNTLVISIGKFNDAKYFRYKIHDQSDLDDTCEIIKEFLLTRGMPFMEDSYNLNSIYHIFNDTPTQTCKYVYNQMNRCFKGAIAAKLVHSTRFLDLVDTHRNMLVKIGGTPEELLAYERLLSFLLYHSVN